MKSSIVVLAGLLALISGGFRWQGNVEVSATESLTMAGSVQDIDQISGTWYGFPSGLLLQINQNGTIQFGQDWDGTPIGYRGEVTFRNQQLHVRFTDYDGSEESCETASGRYIVQLHESGAIRFNPVQDDCLLRLQILGGESDLGMLYHRFDND